MSGTLRSPVRLGYTLLEMLLALAVLVVIVAIVVPVMLHVYDEQKLQKAAEDVRIQAAATRLRAVDSGVTYQFRYEPGGRRYVSVPYESDEDLDADVDATTAGGTLRRDSGELPEGMHFEPAEAFVGSEGSFDQLAPEALAGLPDAAALGGTAWSPPILFHHDGSAQDAAFDVFNANQKYVRLLVRELTGAVSASQVQREGGR